MLKQLYRKNRHSARLVIMTLLWCGFMAVTCFDKFFNIRNFPTIAAKIPEYGLMSLGVMLCMITGGIDLSCVSVANLTAILMALFMKSRADADGGISALAIAAALVMSVLCGLAAGAFNGVLISKVGIPPILATLGVNQLLTGVSMVITNGKEVSGIPQAYVGLINNKLWNVVPGKRGTVSGLIPVPLLIFIAVSVFVWFILARTTYGRRISMIGTNAKVARFSGLNVDWILVKTYAVSGMCAALGGMIMLANYSGARSDFGSQYTLQSILIVVLGGVDPNGGRGKMSGVMLALVLLALLEAGINRFPQISSFYITLIWGAVLLLVMAMNRFESRSANGKKTA